MGSRRGWLLGLLLLVGCGGGEGPADPAVTPWEWPDTVTDTLVFAPPTTVAYTSPEGSPLAAPAVPGQVLVEFRPEVGLPEAVALLASVGGRLLDCVPQRHLALADVPVGTEGAAIDDLRALPQVRFAGPNDTQELAGELLAVDACVGDDAEHGAAVVALLDRCAGADASRPPAYCLDHRGSHASNSYLTYAALRVLHAAASAELVVNVSLQPGLEDGQWWGTLSSGGRDTYLDRYANNVMQLLRTAEQLRGNGRNVVFTLAAGNYGVPLETVLLRLELDPALLALLREHLVIVGVPREVQPGANATTHDSEHFVRLDQNRTPDGLGWGTSFAAPRLAALVARTMREGGLSATQALAQVKQQARAAGGTLRDVCPCVSGLRILADTVTDDLSAIDSTIALNDVGDIGFTGLDDGGLSRAYVARANGTLAPLGFAPSATRNYGGAAITASSAAPPALLVRERVSGSPLGFVLRKWATDGTSSDVIVGSNTTLEGGPAFDSVSLHVDVNDLGLAAFAGLVEGSTETALMGGYQRSAGPPVEPRRLAQFAGVHGLRPAVANTGEIVIQTPLGSIVRYAYAGGAPTVIASAPTFSATGLSPGISNEGDYVAFYGDLTSAGAAALTLSNSSDAPALAPGPGIFLSLATATGRDVVRVAGLDALVTAFQPTLRVAVRSEGPGQATVCYTATRNGSLGVYVRSVDRDGLVPGIGVSAPCEVLQAGDVVFEDADGDGQQDAGEVRLAGTVADIGFQHPLSKTGTRDMGLWVRTTTGDQAVVRARVTR